VPDAPKQVLLARAVEVVHGQRREDEVERASRQVFLEAGEPEIGIRQQLGGTREHLPARVDPHEARNREDGRYPSARLSRSRTELEQRLGLDSPRRGGDPILQLVEGRHLGAHQVEVVLGRKVKLAHPRTIDRGASTVAQPFRSIV
jgi:hypothetical protein